MASDLREGGFIVLHRRVQSSALWRSFTAEQAWVAVKMLFLANWKDSRILRDGEWHVIKRGELTHSENKIATEASVSRKVVRTTITKMLADDISAGGNGPFLKTRWTGPVEGQGLRVLSICRYSEYQDKAESKGPTVGPTEARQGPSRGPAGAPSEEREPREPREQPTLVAVAPPPSRPPAKKEKPPADPRHALVCDLLVVGWLNTTGSPYHFHGARDGAAVKRLLTYPEATDPEITHRLAVYLQDPFCVRQASLAHFVSKWSGIGSAATSKPIDWQKGRAPVETIDWKGKTTW